MLDVIIVSKIFDKYYRLRVSDVPKRVGSTYIYTADVIDTSDHELARARIDLDVDTFNAITRSSILRTGFNGMPSIVKMVWKAPHTTIVSLGHFEYSEDKLYYIPEYSDDAVIMNFIDFDLNKTVIYVPDFKAHEYFMYLLDSDEDRLVSLDLNTQVNVKTPMILYALSNRMHVDPYVMSSIDVMKPRILIVHGKLALEGLVGSRVYVRFVPGVDREVIKNVMQGWGLVQILGDKVIDKLREYKLPEQLVLPAKYWRDFAMFLKSQLNTLYSTARSMGLSVIADQVRSMIENIDNVMAMSREMGINIPAILDITRALRSGRVETRE